MLSRTLRACNARVSLSRGLSACTYRSQSSPAHSGQSAVLTDAHVQRAWDTGTLIKLPHRKCDITLVASRHDMDRNGVLMQLIGHTIEELKPDVTALETDEERVSVDKKSPEEVLTLLDAQQKWNDITVAVRATVKNNGNLLSLDRGYDKWVNVSTYKQVRLWKSVWDSWRQGAARDSLLLGRAEEEGRGMDLVSEFETELMLEFDGSPTRMLQNLHGFNEKDDPVDLNALCLGRVESLLCDEGATDYYHSLEQFQAIREQVMIHHRNRAFVWNLREVANIADSVVFVVGAMHVPGIRRLWRRLDEMGEVGLDYTGAVYDHAIDIDPLTLEAHTDPEVDLFTLLKHGLADAGDPMVENYGKHWLHYFDDPLHIRVGAMQNNVRVDAHAFDKWISTK